jgi:hypothetical protein
VSTVNTAVRTTLRLTGKTLWVVSTSSLLLVLPVLYEQEMDQALSLQEQQQALVSALNYLLLRFVCSRAGGPNRIARRSSLGSSTAVPARETTVSIACFCMFLLSVYHGALLGARLMLTKRVVHLIYCRYLSFVLRLPRLEVVFVSFSGSHRPSPPMFVYGG